MAIVAVPLTGGRAAAFSPPCMRQRFLPVAAAFWQGVPARVRAKQRGAWRKGKGSRVGSPLASLRGQVREPPDRLSGCSRSGLGKVFREAIARRRLDEMALTR